MGFDWSYCSRANLPIALYLNCLHVITWKGLCVRQGDVTIAKNYLSEEEINELNRVVTQCI